MADDLSARHYSIQKPKTVTGLLSVGVVRPGDGRDSTLSNHSRRVSLRQDLLALVGLLLFLLTGHWAQLLGWQQPVGGDKTAFFFGRMSHYGDCLRQGELPTWNGHWGFGFAGFAESQCGVLYPPHLMLYRWLPAIAAFRWDFLLHRLLGALLAYASIRGLGLRPLGAWVATLALFGGGFAVGHLDHQWAVLAVVWLLPAVWATQQWLLFGRRTALLALPLILALQLLIGHFQIAFMTLVTAALYAAGIMITRWPRQLSPSTPLPLAVRGIGWLLAVGLGYGLAAVQLVPTWQLQQFLRSDGSASGWEYLSTHAQPPWLSANLVFPYLYFLEPLWRDVVWTPVHAAPEESLAYVGLLPLALALGGLWRGRRQPFVRCWAAILVVTWWLACGPFVPGFRWLTMVPGFSFFRAAGRWTLIQHVALGILAGWTIDRVSSSRRLLYWWLRLMLLAVVLAGLLSAWWYRFDRSARQGRPPPTLLAGLVHHLVPWDDGQTATRMVQDLARPRSWDAYTRTAWLKIGRPDHPARLIDLWPEVLRREALPSVVVLLAGLTIFGVAAWCSRRGRWAVVLLCLGDLWMFQAVFADKSAPIDRLTPPGPLLSRLAELPAGSRIDGPGGNLLMAWGLAPIRSYRTLDVPWPTALQQSVQVTVDKIIRGEDSVLSLTEQLLGLRAVVVSFAMSAGQAEPVQRPGTQIFDDGQLDWWLDGDCSYRDRLRAVGRQLRTAVFPVTDPKPAAIIVPREQLRATASQAKAPACYRGLYSAPTIAPAGTATFVRAGTSTRQWSVKTEEPALLVLGELYLPGWEATVTTKQAASPPNDASRVALARASHYWQAIPLDRAGEYSVVLEYRTPGLAIGIACSLLAGLVWIGLAGLCWWRR